MSTERLAGTTRYGTAKAIAAHASMGTPTGAIVATGQNFPDALAAATLAGANGPKPIVLTETSVYTLEAKEALAALKAKFATLAVTIVGGTAAVSSDVEASIKADGFTVTRVGGIDRYDTANLIARAANTAQTGGSGLVGGAKTAIFATGQNFPDALAAGPAAYRNDLPILLVTADTLPDSTKGAITALGIKNAVIVGGTTVISAEVQAQIATATGDTTVERLAGANRNATAAVIGDYESATLAFPMSSAGLATGLNFPDALALGPFMGVVGGPIVLTASLPPESAAFLDKYSYSISKLWVSGGTAAIDDATVTAAQTSAQTTGNDLSATDAPDLIAVASAGVDTGTGGQIWRYTFDETIQATPITAGSFVAYTPYGERVAATSVARDTANTSAVLALFALADTVKLGEATVFAVAANAVQDTSAKFNPEGELPGPATRTFAAGTTRGPDLVSVAAASGSTTTFDFTFDENIATAAAGSFLLVDTNTTTTATHRTATSATVQTDPKVVRAVFAANASGTAVRGVVLGAADAAVPAVQATAAAIGTGVTANNATQTKDIASGGLTNAPDLVSVTLNSSNNTATFTFDEALGTITGGDAGRNNFHLVYRQGNARVTSLHADVTSASGATTVLATFAPGTVNGSVALAYVESETVARFSDAAVRNGWDSEPNAASSFTAGTFNGPELVSAVRSTFTPFGGSATTRVAFTWDEAVSLTNAGNFFYVAVDGTRTAFTGCVLSGTTIVNCDTTSAALGAAIGAARQVTVAQGAVTGSTITNTAGNLPNTVANHEERAPI